MKFYSVDRKLNNFNDYVRGELKRQKISQEDAAYRLGIPQSGLSRRLAGQAQWTMREVFILTEIIELDLEKIGGTK